MENLRRAVHPNKVGLAGAASALGQFPGITFYSPVHGSSRGGIVIAVSNGARGQPFSILLSSTIIFTDKRQLFLPLSSQHMLLQLLLRIDQMNLQCCCS